MNILVFSWRDPKHPLAGGAEQVVHEHAKGWVKAGHFVTHFSSRFPGSEKEEIIDGIKFIRQGNQYLGVQIAAFFYYLKNRDKYNLIVDEFHGLPFFTPLYVAKPKLAIIQETAGKVWFLNPLPKPFNLLFGLLGFLLEPLIFLFYKKVPLMTGSKSAKDDIIKFGIPAENIHVINHGVIVKKPIPFPDKEKIPTICFLGILSKDKGIEDALKTFSILSGRGVYQFWVIGRQENKEYGKKVLKLTRDLGIKDKVKFWGHVTQDKKFELLARSHLLINPSVREGWGLVNIEANSMGTPVIAYQSAGLIDSVKDHQSGIICKHSTPMELSQMIEEVIKDKNLYKILQNGAFEWSNKFSWEQARKLSVVLINKIYCAKDTPLLQSGK